MLKLRLAGALLAAATAAGMLSAGAAPAQAAPAHQAMMMGRHLEAGLHGSRAYPRAGGHAEYASGYRYRHLDVRVWNIRRLAGRTLVVYVHGTWAGRMTVSRYGYAHMYRDRGVPRCQAGQSVRVRTRSGTLVVSGTFHRW